MDLTTPAVLFPAFSLLLLAHTNRLLGLGSLLRNLHDLYQAKPDPLIAAQIGNLRFRVILIRNMQAVGVLSLLVCVTCMMLLVAEYELAAKTSFGISLVLMALSLIISLVEIQISANALNLQLRDLERLEDQDTRSYRPPIECNGFIVKRHGQDFSQSLLSMVSATGNLFLHDRKSRRLPPPAAGSIWV